MGDFDVIRRWPEVEVALGVGLRGKTGVDAANAAREGLASLGLGAPGGAASALRDEAPHWLLAYGSDAGRVLVVLAVPEAAIPAEVREGLAAERGRGFAVVFQETCFDAPWQWTPWAWLTLGVGVHSVEAFAGDLDARAGSGITTPDASTLATWVGSAQAYVVAASDGRPSDASRLDVALVGFCGIREMSS